MTRLLHPTAEGAALIGVGRSTLYELIKAGEIQAVKIGRRTLIPHDELERYVRSLTTAGAFACDPGDPPSPDAQAHRR